MEDRTACRLCGGKLVDSRDQAAQFMAAPRNIVTRPSRAKPLAVLTISVAVLVEGVTLTFLPNQRGPYRVRFFCYGSRSGHGARDAWSLQRDSLPWSDSE